MTSSAERARITFRMERWRSIFGGIIETAGNTFLLLIATRVFDLGPWAKALIAAGTSVGLLLSPVVVNAARSLGMQPSRAVSSLLALGGLSCFVITLLPHPWVYTTGCVLALLASTCAIPLMTQIYHDNYPADQRGKLYSSAFMVRIASAMVFAWIGGQILNGSPIPGMATQTSTSIAPERWRWMTALFAVSYMAAAAAVRRIPTRPLDSSAALHPLQGLRFVREDPVFRNALMAWMLMGFANLAMLPIRVEYLGNPRFGLGLSAAEIAWLTLVIPNGARWIMSPIWGRLFDRMNFFRLRITLNAGFAVGIATFFMSETPMGLIIGAIFYGISTAGGDVAWGLWVTKVAPPAHVTDYMAVHTFSTGIRGVLAPICAFQAVQTWSPATMGWIAAAMILAACGLLIPEIRGADSRR
ncbi:MAG: hypothetical protein RLZZ582_843 [Verrucomicrobiota bacterium]